MIKKFNYQLLVYSLAVILVGLGISAAQADEDDGESALTVAVNAKWKEECGGCHIAYPARFLSSQSWRALMAGLDNHFGSDASLDEATAREITTFLEKNADQRRRQSDSKVVLRISEMRWFKSEHDEISSRTWKNPRVKSPSNCGACHTRADMDDYSERNVRIPR